MGLNNEYAARVVFDIETAPLPEAVDYLEPVEAPSNYKDPIKIAEYVAAKQAENLQRCGLDVDLCRIVAIGWWRENQDEPQADVVKGNEYDERSLLAAFWSQVENGSHLVGFNCIGFDLPVLQRRSLYLGVKMPAITVDRYRHPQVTDLQQILSYHGALKLRSLSFYARRFGLGIDDPHTGADIAGLVAEGQWAAVEHHVLSDIKKTALLAEKLGYFRPVTAGVL